MFWNNKRKKDKQHNNLDNTKKESLNIRIIPYDKDDPEKVVLFLGLEDENIQKEETLWCSSQLITYLNQHPGENIRLRKECMEAIDNYANNMAAESTQ